MYRSTTYSEATNVVVNDFQETKFNSREHVLQLKNDEFVKTTEDVGLNMESTTDPTSFLQWKDVTLTIKGKGKKGKTKVILDKCSGVTNNTELTAIIGPSGAGKTSLLNTLACRITQGVSPDSQIVLDGKPMNATMGSKIAYVTQADNISPFQTVREALMFSAQLRLPESVSLEAKQAKVEEIIKLLGLEKCADTLVGSDLERGISGGEKKRTSIGIELVTNPAILFLDEPTSGLDSYAAHQTISLLRNLSMSDKGCIILCTIHQPSSEVFNLFDKVFVLADGKTMYGGSNNEMVKHFSGQGHPCPPNFSSSEYVLYLMQTLPPDQLEFLEGVWKKKSEDDSHLRVTRPSVYAKHHSQAGMLTQTMLLTKRELQATWRNKPALYARYGMTAVLNLLFALIFMDTGAWTTNGDDGLEPNDIQSHFGGITQIVISAMFGAAQPMMLEFPLERPIFIREYATDHYYVTSYFISKLLVELPLTLIQSGVIFLVAYWLMDLHGNIWYMILSAWGLSVVSSSVALLLGCALPDVKAAVQLSPAVFVPQLLFAGFFIKIEQIPVFLRWAQYLCSLKFAMNLFLIIEFDEPCTIDNLLKDDSALNRSTAYAIHMDCERLIELNEVEPDLWGVYCGVLVGIFVLFRLLSLMCLKAKGRSQKL